MRLAFTFIFLSASAALADPQLAGRYKGIIWSSGSDGPGFTTLTVAADGSISGTYRYMDGWTPADGTLDDCRFAAPILTCEWTDAYGSGAWVVRFNADRSAFEGSWYDWSIEGRPDRPEGGFKWTGDKTGRHPQM